MEYGKKLTRRRMLQLTGVGVLGAGAMLVGAGCSSSGGTSSSSTSSAKAVTLTVYDPSGNVEVTETFSPRLDTLDGKTIAFLGNDMWEEDRTFALLQELMAKNYPTTTIITPDNFPRHSDLLTVADNGLPEMMKEKNADGVILGNAG